MDLERIDIPAEKIRIDPVEILRLAGNPDGATDRHTRELVDQLTDRCRELAHPKGGFAWFDSGTFLSENELELESVRFLIGKIIARELQRAEAFSLFAVTLGPGPESLGRECIRSGDYLEGYLIDLIGSAMVESLAGEIHAHIKSLAEKNGMMVTNHYSPGYCSWEVGEQQKLFGLLPPDWCGITLSGSSLMSPIKSVSGIIGIGSGVQYRSVSCTLCSMPHCQFRKRPGLL